MAVRHNEDQEVDERFWFAREVGSVWEWIRRRKKSVFWDGREPTLEKRFDLKTTIKESRRRSSRNLLNADVQHADGKCDDEERESQKLRPFFLMTVHRFMRNGEMKIRRGRKEGVRTSENTAPFDNDGAEIYITFEASNSKSSL